MKDSIAYRCYLIAFIDVLGQKEAFQGLDVLPKDDDDELSKKFIQAHRQTVEFVESFRNGFESFFNAYADSGTSKLTVPEGKKEQFDAMRKVILKHQRFSDSIQAFVPLDSGQYHSNVVNGVFGVLTACGAMLLLALVQKKAVRVGVEIGPGTELSNGEVYGPALFKAYELESNIAQYPRVVIGKELINYLRNLENRIPQLPNQTKEDIELCGRLADSCLKMIVKDVDGYPILDYLGEEFRKNIRADRPIDPKMSFDDISRMAFAFVQSEQQKWREKRNAKLAVRYHLLQNYFSARMN
jgi:hypothetical protein